MQDISVMTICEKFLLHARADRVVRSFVAAQLEPYQLTMMEWLLLGVVTNGPKDGVSMSTAAQTLDVTLPQITALANKLLGLKLIRQKTQSYDRRSRHILPTGKGKTVLEDIEASISNALEEWLGGLTRERRDDYIRNIHWLATHKYPEANGASFEGDDQSAE
jgi:DNA-binding MarR family transcriptional regulator